MANKKITPQSTQPRIKDPKKVAAGKARALNALKDSGGRYVSKVLANEVTKGLLAVKGVNTSKLKADQTKKIEKIAKEAGVTKKELKTFFEYNREAYDAMIKTGETKGAAKNSNQLEDAIINYTGKKIFIDKGDGKKIETTKAKALLQFQRFKQSIISEINAVDIVMNPRLTFDGKMNLKIPDTKKFIKEIQAYLGYDKSDGDFDFGNYEAGDIQEAITEALNDMYGSESDEVAIYVS